MSKNIILLINTLNDGGAEKAIQTLYKQLLDEGYKIELLALEKNKFHFSDKIKIKYLINSSFKPSGIRSLILLPILAYKLYRYVKENEIKIVQSHLFRANYVNLLSKLLFKSDHHIQIVNHSIISRYKKNGISGMINLKLIKKLYPIADKIISVSNIVEKDMQNLFKFNNKKKIIFNMFDIDLIKKNAKEAIESFKFKKNKKYLISIGRLIPIKRNKDLLFAISKLDTNIELIFLGQGSEKKNIIKIAKNLGLLKRIHFLGWVENPYKYLYRSDIFISTSQSESFCRVIVEAMICNVPVISSNSGGPQEIIKQDVNGFLFNIGDIDSLIKKINLILNKKNLTNSILLNANKNLEKFSKKKIISDYKSIIDPVL
jgi:N-acetylgalactosamine-N,N'-diacetylbacillosaminyl-diphospho-undecaprenol 4-alpha-N-acetylgalactosaminyltransferase